MKYHTDFNQTKYTRWYYELVQHRQNNPAPKSEYRESHHIVPESFYINRKREGAKGWLEGNADAKENKVWLTGREHALCHWLLKKMTSHNTRAYELMVYSFNMMWVGGEHQGREMSRMITRAYERNRIEWSRIHSETMKGKEPWNKGRKEDRVEVLANVKAAAQNRPPLSPEKKEKANTKRKKTMTGKKQSKKTRDKRSKSMIGLIRGPMDDEHKRKISVSTSKPKPEGHGVRVAAAVIGNISINKDGKEKRVKEHQLQEYLDSGWALGGRLRKKKVIA
jgi:hypothetical protein